MTTRLSDLSVNSEKDISWKPMNEKWSSFLLSNHFYLNDTTYSIEYAIFNAGLKMNHDKLRTTVARYIRKIPYHEFWKLIQNYKETNVISNVIKKKYDFIQILKTPDFEFPGDITTLHLLSNALDIDIVIFSETNPLINKLSDKHDKVVLLYKKNDESGFQNMAFKYKTPVKKELIVDLLDENEHLLQHIKHWCTVNNSKVTLNSIFRYLESVFEKEFTINERRNVIKTIKVVLLNQDFLAKITN